MADNVVANLGEGGATFATDDIGGVQYPRHKIIIGADGVNDGSFIADLLLRSNFRLKMLKEEEIDLEDVFMGITKGITN